MTIGDYPAAGTPYCDPNTPSVTAAPSNVGQEEALFWGRS